jgi:hypothetical protein
VVAALGGVLRVAEMLIHLELQPGLGDLLRQAGQQLARTDEINPVGTRLLDD